MPVQSFFKGTRGATMVFGHICILFFIIRESIDITMLKPYDGSAKIVNGGQHEMRKLAFRPPWWP